MKIIKNIHYKMQLLFDVLKIALLTSFFIAIFYLTIIFVCVIPLKLITKWLDSL